MDANIEFLIRKKLTNAICLLGSSLAIEQVLLKNKYVAKKELRRYVTQQKVYLDRIEEAKNQLLLILNL